MVIRGRVRKLGDNIDTDTITLGSLLHLGTEKLAQHAFEPITPDVAKSVRAG
jgi:3-isopropylmalate dehydratase small subunit